MAGKINQWLPLIKPEISQLKPLADRHAELVKEDEKIERDLRRLRTEMQSAAGIYKTITLQETISGAMEISISLNRQILSLRNQAGEIIGECICKKIGYHQYGSEADSDAVNEEQLVRDYLWGVFKNMTQSKYATPLQPETTNE